MSDQHPPPPHPAAAFHLPRYAWWQVTHTLETLLPPPLADTPEALLARDNAAIAKVSDMSPANSDEADLAATCVAVRAQAEETLGQIRRIGDSDPKEAGRLTRLYLAAVRTALSVHRQLQRTQAIRQKRDKDSAASSADDWMRHIATSEMQWAQEQRLGPALPPPPAPQSLEYQTPAPGPALARPTPPPAESAAAPPFSTPAGPKPSAARPAVLGEPSPGGRLSRNARPEPEEPPRDLDAEVEHYAAVYPRHVRAVRQHGGLPPDCTFGPPDDELLAALVRSRSPAVLAIDADPRIV